jgi:hypothetical protein
MNRIVVSTEYEKKRYLTSFRPVYWFMEVSSQPKPKAGCVGPYGETQW